MRYDANGNRLGIGLAVDAIYDASNRLVDDGTVTYAYDAEGTRVRAGSKVFVRDLLEVDGANSTRFYYLGQERLARRDQDGAVAYYHGDAVGTVRALTAPDGTVAGARLDFAFGELVESTGLADPFGIAGQRRDASRPVPHGRAHDGPGPRAVHAARSVGRAGSVAAAVAQPLRLRRQQPDPAGRSDGLPDRGQGRQAQAEDEGGAPARAGGRRGRWRRRPADRASASSATCRHLRWTDETLPGSLFDAPRLYSKVLRGQRQARAAVE